MKSEFWKLAVKMMRDNMSEKSAFIEETKLRQKTLN